VYSNYATTFLSGLLCARYVALFVSDEISSGDAEKEVSNS
jgi:hypothetical protein